MFQNSLVQTVQTRTGSHIPALAESMNGATEHVQPPLQRVAADGNSYTEKEFADWYRYGAECRDQWVQAEQGGATEHSEPPNHAEHAHAPNIAPEYMVRRNVALIEASEAQGRGFAHGHENNPAPERDDTRGNAQIIWSMQEALDFRAGFHGQQAAFHKEAREALNSLTQSAELGAAEHSLDDYFHWKEYVALNNGFSTWYSGVRPLQNFNKSIFTTAKHFTCLTSEEKMAMSCWVVQVVVKAISHSVKTIVVSKVEKSSMIR